MGGAPRLRPAWRWALVLLVVAGGFVSYYFQLTRARTFQLVAFAFIALVLLGRRIWWMRTRPPAARTGS